MSFSESTTSRPRIRMGGSSQFEIGDRVRSKLHPIWQGTVVARNLTAYSVNWDQHGIETVHSELLELVAAAREADKDLAKDGKIR